MGDTLNTPEEAFGGSMAKITGILDEFVTCPTGRAEWDANTKHLHRPGMWSFLVLGMGRRF